MFAIDEKLTLLTSREARKGREERPLESPISFWASTLKGKHPAHLYRLLRLLRPSNRLNLLRPWSRWTQLNLLHPCCLDYQLPLDFLLDR